MNLRPMAIRGRGCLFQTLKVPGQVALVAEADSGRDLGERQGLVPVPEQLLGTFDTTPNEILVGRLHFPGFYVCSSTTV
jgi:hypothetical protein